MDGMSHYGYVYELWVEDQLVCVSGVMAEPVNIEVPFGKAGVHHGGEVREVKLWSEDDY